MLVDNDDNFNDFYDGPDFEKKKPVLTSEEIEEKQEKEDTINLRSVRRRKIYAWIITIFVFVFALWVYFRYYNPYVTDAQETGYIMKIEKRGLLFKTYEGEMISVTSLEDSARTYQRDFVFSFENDSIAKLAMDLQGNGEKVKLRYKSYNGLLPWRGASKNIITAIEK